MTYTTSIKVKGAMRRPAPFCSTDESPAGEYIPVLTPRTCFEIRRNLAKRRAFRLDWKDVFWVVTALAALNIVRSLIH